MKRFVCLLVTLFCVFKAGAQEYAVINGVVEEKGLTSLRLYKVVDGATVECGKYPIREDRTFRIEYVPEREGFYAIGHAEKKNMFYLKKGDQVNLRVLERTNIALEGKNSAENEVLFKWFAYADYLIRNAQNWMEGPLCTYVEFFPEFERLEKELPAFRKTLKSGNKHFDRLLDRVIDYQMDYWAMRFVQTPRSVHPKDEDIPAYYREMMNKRTVDARLLELPFGTSMFRLYLIMAKRFYAPNGTIGEANAKMLEFIQDSRCRELFLEEVVFEGCRGYLEFMECKNTYGKYLQSEDVIAHVNQMEITLQAKDSGVAPDFTYPDVNGKSVSLSDFKGKIVLIDVWATWCGPCREQMPHLLKLEEELSDSGIVFLGVSLDKAADREKWLRMIGEKGLKGVQLIADGWSQITKDYEIKGIPRFIVVGKDGKLVARQAPAPSDPALKQMLLELLKK